VSTTETRLDPITFEVLRSSLVTICDEMGVRLCRTAFSPVVTEGRDFTFALFDADGHLAASGHWDMPVHFGTFEGTIASVRKTFGEDINEGDIFLYNDPYTGGTHNNDMRAVRPVFHEGTRIGWIVACAHWPDVGGPLPGTFNPSATECYAEGIRVPAVKIYDRGVRVESIIQLVMANVRNAAGATGDLQAMVGCCLGGDDRLRGLAEKYGRETLFAAYRESMDYAERILRTFTEALPNGVYEWTDHIDQDPAHPDHPPVKIHLRMTVEDGQVEFDFTDSDPAPMGAVGSPMPTTWSGVLSATLNVFPGVPLNFGVSRVLSMKTRPNSVVHLLPPTPASGMAACAFEKVVACTLGVLGLADPARKTACIFNLTNVVVGGQDERFGNRPWVMYFWLPGGYGATARGDSTLPSHMLFGPGVKIQPVEVHERFYPVLFDELCLREDSAGPGRYRGGYGVRAKFHLTHGKAKLSVLGDRQRFAPWGVEGGGDGGNQSLWVDPDGDDPQELGMFATGVDLPPASTVLYYSGGGGGYGNPLERDPELLIGDVVDGVMSLETARTQYGVVLREVGRDDGGFAVDVDATAEERERLRASRA
jgi:N-methylhydantoinase B